jgi:hypothetical protein
MLGITGTSRRVDAGHIMTLRDHLCGEFRDTAANAAGNRLAEGKSELTGLLGGPTRSEKE